MCVQGSRQKILLCARESFHQAGYHATSVDEILKRAGVAKSNFYYHFRSKEELADAVLEIQIEEYEALLLRSLHNNALEPLRRLEHFCDQVCYIQTSGHRLNGCPFGNFAAAMSDDEPKMERFRVRLCSVFSRIETALRVCFEDGAARGQFRSDVSAAEMARFALAALEGLMILTKTHREPGLLSGGLQVMRRMLETGQSGRQK